MRSCLSDCVNRQRRGACEQAVFGATYPVIEEVLKTKRQVGLKPVLVVSAAQTKEMTAIRVLTGEHLPALESLAICTSVAERAISLFKTLNNSILLNNLYVRNSFCWWH